VNLDLPRDFGTALKTITEALTLVKGQLQSLQDRGKSHLPSFKQLSGSYLELSRRRQELLALNGSNGEGKKGEEVEGGGGDGGELKVQSIAALLHPEQAKSDPLVQPYAPIGKNIHVY
jgi:hypothetical protein